MNNSYCGFYLEARPLNFSETTMLKTLTSTLGFAIYLARGFVPTGAQAFLLSTNSWIASDTK